MSPVPFSPQRERERERERESLCFSLSLSLSPRTFLPRAPYPGERDADADLDARSLRLSLRCGRRGIPDRISRRAYGSRYRDVDVATASESLRDSLAQQGITGNSTSLQEYPYGHSAGLGLRVSREISAGARGPGAPNRGTSFASHSPC